MMQSNSARTFESNWALAGLLLCCVTVPAAGQAVTAESLQGSTVEATVNYDVRGIRDGEPFASPGSVTYVLRFAAGGAFTGSVTRTATARGGNPVTSTSPMSGTLGSARSLGGRMGGHMVWALSGNTLRMLRTYETGGKTVVITFNAGGRSCSVRSPFMRETGAGSDIRRGSVGGRAQQVAISSAREVSSSCGVSR
jgi:hypothetical protein